MGSRTLGRRMTFAALTTLRGFAFGVFLTGGALLASNAPLSEGVERGIPVAGVLAEPGRALRTAVEALERGDSQLADALLRATAERHPILADHADLLRMRLRVEGGDAEGAIAFEPRWSSRESPLRARFYALLGRAHRERGDESAARAAWEFAAVASRDRERLAELEMWIADSYLREGRHEAAAERLLEVWTRYAELDPAERAERELLALERRLERPLRGANHHRKRGDRLYRRYHNEDALEAYDRALAMGLPKRDRSRVAHRRAETLFRLRRYPEAIGAFADLSWTESREIQRARAMARSGRVGEGARALEKLGAERRGAQAVRAQYLAALLWDGEDEVERAGRLFEGVIRRAPNSSYAGASRWWLGWSAYRAGRLESAERHFAELARLEDDPISALRPRFWGARVREQQGDPEAAALYAEIAHEFPFTYYGWRSLARSGAPAVPRTAEPLATGRRALGPMQLLRPRALVEAGLIEEATDELSELFDDARGIADRLELADLYAEIGDYNRAQRLMVDAYGERLSRGPDPEHIALWWHAWPAPYEDELREANPTGPPSPALVYSIMREESGYRPEVISVSGARGLLQLMPDTAKRVARSVSRASFDPDELFEPAVNIELGSAYLGQLLERFDGYASAAIGSYNAGPAAVSRWLGEEPIPDDVWVEQIPYGQTRAYVKRVLRSLHAYRVLY